MGVTFELVPPCPGCGSAWCENPRLECEEPVISPREPTRLPPIQCLCGRFAKNLGTRHHYNGTWDLITTTVLCSRCGEVDIEHV